MPNDIQNRLSVQNVCRTLLKKGLITSGQAEQILKKKDALEARLKKQKSHKQASGTRSVNPVTSVDIIAALNLECAGDDSRVLDEELIFQTLADEWEIPFKKIDPLKLDLNLVTTTIPRSFAMKHLVLPVAIKDGCLTVATPNPFNVEIIASVKLSWIRSFSFFLLLMI